MLLSAAPYRYRGLWSVGGSVPCRSRKYANRGMGRPGAVWKHEHSVFDTKDLVPHRPKPPRLRYLSLRETNRRRLRSAKGGGLGAPDPSQRECRTRARYAPSSLSPKNGEACPSDFSAPTLRTVVNGGKGRPAPSSDSSAATVRTAVDGRPAPSSDFSRPTRPA